jgi:SAM-dependent methyltransferase
MDAYTARTRKWLDDRFRWITEDGVFFANQNVYGFKSSYCNDGVILRYAILVRVITALRRLSFDSFLDVGGAEGYMAAVVRKFFGARVRSCDLSQEACTRARELFDIHGDVVDATCLPYSDRSFDVVLSSETLEHLPDYRPALAELLRVARGAVIVTVPHDGPETIARNLADGTPHAHLHDFTLDSLWGVVPAEYAVHAEGFHSRWTRIAFRLIDGRPLPTEHPLAVPRFLALAANPLLAASGRLLGQRAFMAALAADAAISRTTSDYRQLMFVIVKEPTMRRLQPHPDVDVDDLLDFRVPLHHLGASGISKP